MIKSMSKSQHRRLNSQVPGLRGPENGRLLFLLMRDGLQATRDWALRTARIYRKAVLNNGKYNRPFHFASAPYYRRKFIEAYLHLKRFAL